MNRYRVWSREQDESDAVEITAEDMQKAAERWVSWRESYNAEYSVASGQAEIDVCVRPIKGRAEMLVFRVSGETVAVYSARLVP